MTVVDSPGATSSATRPIRAELWVYTGGNLLRPDYRVFVGSEATPGSVLDKHRESRGATKAERLSAGELVSGDALAAWVERVVEEWHSRQPLPVFGDLDTGIIYEMEEGDLPESVKRCRRIWE